MYIDGIGEIDEDVSEEEIVEIKRLLAEKERLEEEAERLKNKINELKPQIHALAKKENIGRNDPCLCGSGKKYKKCCGR
ncbi:SEC-C metal-binding domain-containing protein [Petroclostridium sp. X23]|jgi:preprotein translocase subunit SecA|uniref:SEC-C metal-binding domain-containing protein n=1 Tax=Petroclostridium sp. X23 TaxID=3045146 RepID=UPI0024AC8ACD|nr:SEC-C metal-binding domain-containing protein [Petroclostridium sp. X23]WHH61306.1 SEC-C metal-binding domain-containing protein [Petroclostridium sp. X23]